MKKYLAGFVTAYVVFNVTWMFSDGGFNRARQLIKRIDEGEKIPELPGIIRFIFDGTGPYAQKPGERYFHVTLTEEQYNVVKMALEMLNADAVEGDLENAATLRAFVNSTWEKGTHPTSYGSERGEKAARDVAQRLNIVLRAIAMRREGYSFAEIADQVGLEESTVRELLIVEEPS